MLKVIGWVDYDDFNFGTAKGTDEEIEAVAKNIRENGYKFGGDDHENYSNCCPVLSNGKALRLSWRNWGYVMAKAYDLKTESGDYNYILWYMGEYGPEKRVFPKDEKINLTDAVIGKTFEYEISEEEYHAVYNASFTSLVLPTAFFDTIDLKTFDRVLFRYKGKTLLETVINELRFCYYTIDELLTEDTLLLSRPCDDTNYRDFNKETLKAFILNKYRIDSDKLISLCFDIVDDKREGSKLYV